MKKRAERDGVLVRLITEIGVSELAKRLSALADDDENRISPQGVSKWHRVPAERVLDVEKVTNGGFTRHELRPDLYPEDRPESQSRRQDDSRAEPTV